MYRKSAYVLFLAVLGLLVIGIIMLFSTSAFAHNSHGDVYFFIKRQAIWFGIGLVACTFAALIDYHFWQRTWWLWVTLALIALVLCYVPHLGMRINGSRRWVGYGQFVFQPSELAKIAALLFLAAWFSRYENAGNNWLQGFVIPLAIIRLLAVLVLGEVDLGTTALLGTTAFVVMFVAGAKLLWLGIISFAGLGALLIVATQISERMGRLSAFLHPQSTKDDVGEELGLRFSLLVVFLFVVIIVCGIMIALHAKDRFGLLLGCGVVSLLALQAAVNIGVTTSLLPNKGLPLPFISYGGSNLVACMFGVGLLLNIYRQGVLEPARQQNATMRVRTTPRI